MNERKDPLLVLIAGNGFMLWQLVSGDLEAYRTHAGMLVWWDVFTLFAALGLAGAFIALLIGREIIVIYRAAFLVGVAGVALPVSFVIGGVSLELGQTYDPTATPIGGATSAQPPAP